jgi:mannose-6-phosphate isomerase-like protein (cupin superfamily)
VSGRIARIDELELFPIEGQEGLTWRPVRRHFDIQAFGVNAYTADQAGKRVVEEHREEGGHEELYVVLSGRAIFMLDGEEHDAPAGTLVHCPPGTPRGAVAAEPGTTVLGIGAKPSQGQEEAARREFDAGIEAYPDAWQGYYNLACVEAKLGNRDLALAQLRRAAEIDQAVVSKYAPEDEDFALLKDDPDFLAITGQAKTNGASS